MQWLRRLRRQCAKTDEPKEEDIIRLTWPCTNEGVVTTFGNAYEGLHAEHDATGIFVYKASLKSEDLPKLETDIAFFMKTPFIPLENLCSRLDNYNPQNPSQEKLLEYAKELVSLKDMNIPAGIFAYGEPGVGKTHISVALAKEFMRRGMTPNFAQFSSNNTFPLPYQLRLVPEQVWVLDDLNTYYGSAPEVFKSVSLNVHNTGGRVFVTSNMAYDEYTNGMRRIMNEAEAKRYFDRMKGMYEILHIDGTSQRKRTSWHSR